MSREPSLTVYAVTSGDGVNPDEANPGGVGPGENRDASISAEATPRAWATLRHPDGTVVYTVTQDGRDQDEARARCARSAVEAAQALRTADIDQVKRKR